jgi:hypothetical protein
MTVPISLMLPLMQQASTMMRDQSGAKAQIHANQVALVREKYRLELKLAELDLQDERMRHQRTIMEKMISANSEINRQKLDLIREFFQTAAGLLRRHQDALFSEQDKITTKLHSREVTGFERELDDQRLESISADLAVISQTMTKLTLDAAAIVSDLENIHGISEFTLPKLTDHRQ